LLFGVVYPETVVDKRGFWNASQHRQKPTALQTGPAPLRWSRALSIGGGGGRKAVRESLFWAQKKDSAHITRRVSEFVGNEEGKHRRKSSTKPGLPRDMTVFSLSRRAQKRKEWNCFKKLTLIRKKSPREKEYVDLADVDATVVGLRKSGCYQKRGDKPLS